MEILYLMLCSIISQKYIYDIDPAQKKTFSIYM